GARRAGTHAGAARGRGSLRGRIGTVLRSRAHPVPGAGTRRTETFPHHRCHAAARAGVPVGGCRARRRRGSRAGGHAMSAPPDPAWFSEPQREIRAALAGGRLAHGILIHEDAGAGGTEFARWIARLVNCREPQRAPCGECQDCRWIAADQHPDVARIAPLEDSNYIVIEQVRGLIAELTLTALGKGYKVAIFTPADALYPNAAHSLLKTLEEPPARTLLLLVTSQPARLMATVRSRCSRIRLPGPAAAEAAAFLEAVRGAGPWAEALAATGG